MRQRNHQEPLILVRGYGVSLSDFGRLVVFGDVLVGGFTLLANVQVDVDVCGGGKLEVYLYWSAVGGT